MHGIITMQCTSVPGRVANPRPVARIKTGRVAQPITDAADATGRDRSWNATRPWQTDGQTDRDGQTDEHHDKSATIRSNERMAHSRAKIVVQVIIVKEIADEKYITYYNP